MRILKIVDGFVTNSSSSGTTILLALKKGKKLGNILEKLGLSAEFVNRFKDEYRNNESDLAYWVEEGYLDSNIYDLTEIYDILRARIITHAFGGEIDDIDHSDFRKKFYDEFIGEDLPIKLVGNDFIFLHSRYDDLEYDHEEKEDIMNRIWQLIEQIKNPSIEISPRQPKTYVVRELLEPRQKAVIEELEQLIQTRIPVIDSINIPTIENFLALDEKDRESLYWEGYLVPKIGGFMTHGSDIIALGFNFVLNNQQPKIYPISIADLPRLKILDLVYYRWKDSPKLFGNPNTVEILRLPTNIKFQSPPESIGKMISLKRLSITDCKGKILPESLGMLKKLEVLEVQNSNYYEKEYGPTYIPSSLGRLRALIILNLKNNNIESIPNTIGNLESLLYFNLSGNRIKTLPDNICNLKSLKEIIINGNQLIELPNSFGGLNSLIKCTLSGNKLKSLLDDFGGLNLLEILNLGSNKLTKLPKSFGCLFNLKFLDLSRNKLSVLPENFGDLKNLEVLNVMENQLEYLPNSIGNFSKLKELTLYKCKLQTLPASIGNLRMLEKLWLNDSLLKELPESIGNLKNLQYLWFSSNSLVKLPDSIGNLHSLKELFVSDNNLEELPDSVGKMVSLEKIRIGKNPIKKLPSSLLELKKLKSLLIDHVQMSSFREDLETIKILEKLKKNGIYISNFM